VQNIEAITSADVERVARQYVNPGSLAVVIVGDRASIEPTLRAINVGPISIRDMTGKPIQ
jgi:zinc protease